MKKNNNDEPRDEFDSVMLPAFLAKPLGFLAGGSGAAGSAGVAGDPESRQRAGGSAAEPTERDPYDPASYADPAPHSDPASGTPSSRWGDDEEAAAAQEPTPTKWWAGARGRTLIYIAGALFWVFIQSRN